jgi:hypothetical protein
LKARDPRVGGQLDASIERAQASNNSVTDIVVTAAEYIAKLLG